MANERPISEFGFSPPAANGSRPSDADALTHQLLAFVQQRPFITPVASPLYDGMLGMGYGILLTERHLPRLEVFPARRILRIQTETMQAQLTNITAIEQESEVTRFHANTPEETTILEVTPAGEVALRTMSRRAWEQQRPVSSLPIEVAVSTALADASSIDVELAGALAVPTVLDESPLPSGAVSDAHGRLSAPGDAEQREKRQRVTLRGTFGREINYRVTPRSHTRLMKFLVAEHDAGGNTTWHTVVAFHDLAQRLHDNLATLTGELEVIGYLTPREVTKEDGTKGVVIEVQAAAVRTHVEKPPQPS